MNVILPLKILERTRKSDGKEFWFIFNRNAFSRVATCTFRRNAIKQNFSEQIGPLVRNLKPFKEPIELIYTLYRGDKRRCDLSNVCSIVDKYFSDVLVKEGVIEDDDYKHIPKVTYLFGGIDKENPRCEVQIEKHIHSTTQ